jgi:hypothetical protein
MMKSGLLSKLVVTPSATSHEGEEGGSICEDDRRIVVGHGTDHQIVNGIRSGSPRSRFAMTLPAAFPER